MARTNVLIANREVALLDPKQEADVLADVVELADLLVDTEMSVNECAARVRADFRAYYPDAPPAGWGFVGTASAELDQIGTYAPTYPECALEAPLIIPIVSGDANLPLARYGYNEGHAVWALARAARVLRDVDATSLRASSYAAVAQRVADEWIERHSGEPNGLPGFYYEEFHDGVDIGDQPHQRLYWAVNSNAALGRALVELAEADGPGSGQYWQWAQTIAAVWKNDVAFLEDGAYVWNYSLSVRPADEYVEDTVHAGVALPFLAAAYTAEPSEGTFGVFASDVAAAAAAIDRVVPAPARDTVRKWMDGREYDGLNLAPVDFRFVGEWAALAPALSVDDYQAAADYLAVLDAVTAQFDEPGEPRTYGYYRLLLDSYAVLALAQ